jgi:hypothetical protein
MVVSGRRNTQPGNHEIGHPVDPRAVVDVLEKILIFALPGFEARTVQPVAYSLYRLSWPVPSVP